MSKRNKIVLETAESKKLKQIREKHDLSTRKVAERIGISKTRVSQIESGRDEVTENYIGKFLKALGLSWEDWTYELGAEDESIKLRQRCEEILSTLEPSKVVKAYEFLIRL